MSKGRFIVFEGIDGCGKGTQLELAHSYLWNRDKKTMILSTREPTKDSPQIREKMRKEKNAHENGEWYVERFIKDRINHCRNYISPALEKGIHVLCDRYKHSTLTYQHAQGIDFQKLIDMHNHEDILIPDLTLIYDCPARIAFERRKNAGATDVFDKDIFFQERLRKEYLRLPQKLPGERIIVIDASRDIEKVFEYTRHYIDDLLGC